MLSRTLIALLLLFGVAAGADPMRFPGFTWDSPIAFGEVLELGPDAYGALYPAEAESDLEKLLLQLVVISTPRESVATMRDGGGEPTSMVVSSLLGLSGRPEQINKMLFMGETEARTVYLSNHPRPHAAHVISKYLDDGSMVTVALRDFSGQQSKLLGQLLQALSHSFVATP